MVLAENPREQIGANNPPDDLHFMDVRVVMLGVEFLQFTFKELDNLFVSGKARNAKRRMGFRRTLEYCLAELVGQEAMAEVIGLCRDTVGDDQAAVRKWAERDDEFAEFVEDIRLGMIGFIRSKVNQERFETRLEHWVAANPRLKKRQTDRDLARRLSREALGALAQIVLTESKLDPIKGKRLVQGHFMKTDQNGASLEAGLAECMAQKLVEDAEPHLSSKPAPQRAIRPTKLGARTYYEAIICGLVQKPETEETDEEDED